MLFSYSDYISAVRKRELAVFPVLHGEKRSPFLTSQLSSKMGCLWRKGLYSSSIYVSVLQ